ncbi:MAG: hypothetical protein LQ345_006825 [Seirophora villosa]|nr:MAG: hypothetical protein LQ345_006825 [Seirophora villosa]
MSRYIFERQRRRWATVTGVNSLILLRADLHATIDTAKKFVFVPEKQPEQNLRIMVTHILSPSAECGPLYNDTNASNHGKPEMKACDTTGPKTIAAATDEPGLSLHDDASVDWDHLCELQNEQQKCDFRGVWLEEVDWAIEVLRHERSARNIQAWAYSIRLAGF